MYSARKSIGIGLVLLGCCLLLGNSRPPRTTPQFKTVDQYVSYLGRTLGEERSKGRISDEYMKVVDRLRDRSASVAECDQLVVDFVRRHFAEDPNAYELRGIRDKEGRVIDGAAYALLIYKGSLAGAYEYTRLCRGQVALEPYASLCSDQQKEKILRYRLYVIVSRLNDSNVDRHVFQRASADRPLRSLVELKSRHPDSKVLNDFIMTYPFDQNSYLNFYTRLAKSQSGIDARKVFYEYMTTLLPSRQERIAFLEATARHNAEFYQSFLVYVAENDSMLTSDAEYVSAMFALSMQTRGWEAAMLLAANPLAKTGDLARYTAFELERVETEQAMLTTMLRDMKDVSRK